MGLELDYRVVDSVGEYMEYLRNGMSLELKIGDVPSEKECPLTEKQNLNEDRTLASMYVLCHLSPSCPQFWRTR